jgi:pimeloyl-ACP methyl ester carboxylesterase
MFKPLFQLVACLAAFASSTTFAAPAATTSKSFDAYGVKIHYLEAGKGDAVVLIHGLDSSAQLNWNINGVIAELAKDHHVIALDMPGHGQSDKPASEKAYGNQIVTDTALLLDHLEIKQAHIVGYSLGGMVSLKFIATHPDRSLSGTLGGMGWLREGSPLQKFWERMPGRNSARTPPEFTHTIGQLALTEDQLKAIKVPVKIIVGERDPVKRLYVVPLEKVRSDWPVVEVPGAGHLNCIMKSQFRDEIVAWIHKQSKNETACQLLSPPSSKTTSSPASVTPPTAAAPLAKLDNTHELAFRRSIRTLSSILCVIIR